MSIEEAAVEFVTQSKAVDELRIKWSSTNAISFMCTTDSVGQKGAVEKYV